MLSQIDKQQIREVLRTVLAICGVFLACRFTRWFAVVAVLLYGVKTASTQQLGRALACYVLFPLLVVMNPYVCSIGGMGQMFLKLGFMVMTLMLVASAQKRKGNESVPMAGLWAYLGVSIFSSAIGYAPLISFMKLVNFAMFLIGLGIGIRNLHTRPKDLMYLRRFFLAIAVVVILGSLFMAFFMPGAAYFRSMGNIINVYGMEAANDFARTEMGMGLLCGITNQSQCLAPLSAVTMIWVLCDMMFVEKRLSKLHLALLIASFPLVYMTRSRCALLASGVGLATVSLYCFRYLPAGPRLKKALKGMFSGLVFVIVVVCVVAEIKDQRITRLIRKTDDVRGDDRSLLEAATMSRRGLVDMSLRDFKRNPVFGTGFQVMENFQWIYRPNQIVWSAQVEKGVLPVMILGEAGLAGLAVFIVFLAMFYGVCTTRRYVVTAGLFTVYLTTNLGEATFFSTGGAGGILWVMAIVGGYTIDMIVLYEKKYKQGLGAGSWPMAAPPPPIWVRRQIGRERESAKWKRT